MDLPGSKPRKSNVNVTCVGRRPVKFISTGLIILLILLSLVQVPAGKAAGTPAPILLVTNASYSGNPFGGYLGEILRAEGLNAYDQLDLAEVGSGTLGAYPLVLLGETPLTSAQASLFAGYVSGGGRLIAMRPDAQIAGLFGLGSAAGSAASDGYLKIDATAQVEGQAVGQGLVTETLQIHGAVDRWNVAGGTVVAGWYSDATTATPYPAVVSGAYGSGRGVAFLYDLARSVVLTRQGNPANANVDVDGDGVFRTIDLFQKAGGGSGWVDLNKVPIPQADEQMRLLSRLVKALAGVVEPLPQLWYFPGTARTMLVMTGDAHANPTSYYQYEINSVTAHGGRMTFYLVQASDPDPASAAAWQAQGYTFGLHPYPTLIGNTEYLTAADISDLKDWFQMRFGPDGVILSRTVRDHMLSWAGWTDAAEYMAANGLAMDFDFYHWGYFLQKPDGSWANGYLTGSGLPMPFVRADGTLIPVYQQLTELVDEMLVAGAGYAPENLTPTQAIAVSKALIDASQNGYYSALTTQNHVDYYVDGAPQTWAEGTLDYAASQGVPVWNGDHWLSFVEARHAANYTNLAWDAGTGVLSFDLSSPAAAGIELTTLLPLAYRGEALQSVSVDGSPVAYDVVDVKGIPTAFVAVPAGNHTFTADYHAVSDLAVSLSGAPDPVAAGASLTYTLSVTNQGPDAAHAVEVTVGLPAQAALLSAVPSQGTCPNGAPLVCGLGVLAPGASATITLTAGVDPAVRGSLTATASVTSQSQDPNPANDSAATTETVQGIADLAAAIQPSAAQVDAGAAFSYTLTVANLGPSTPLPAVVTGRLPLGVAYQGVDAPGWSCAFDAGARSLTCTRSDLGSGQAADVRIDVNAPKEGGTITASASAALEAPDIDPVAGNDTATAGIQVIPHADLALSGAASKAGLAPGEGFTYDLSVANAGLSTASDVSLVSELPAGVTYSGVSSAPSGWACSAAGQSVTCTAAALAPGASAEIVLAAKAPALAGSFTATAVVTEATDDPQPGNNAATIEGRVYVTDLDLSVTQAAEDTIPGGAIAAQIHLANLGPDAAQAIELAIDLPAGAAWNGYTGESWACAPAGGQIHCTLEGLAAGASALLDLTWTAPLQSGVTTSTYSAASVYDDHLENNTVVVPLDVGALIYLPYVVR